MSFYLRFFLYLILKDRLDYGKSPEKTQGGELISAYECDHQTADAEFLLSKAKYTAVMGREQKREADVLCYQIRQSFAPREITPEEANQVGYETAMRWTKGKHAFFVATHTDKNISKMSRDGARQEGGIFWGLPSCVSPL